MTKKNQKPIINKQRKRKCNNSIKHSHGMSNNTYIKQNGCKRINAIRMEQSGTKRKQYKRKQKMNKSNIINKYQNLNDLNIICWNVNGALNKIMI